MPKIITLELKKNMFILRHLNLHDFYLKKNIFQNSFKNLSRIFSFKTDTVSKSFFGIKKKSIKKRKFLTDALNVFHLNETQIKILPMDKNVNIIFCCCVHFCFKLFKIELISLPRFEPIKVLILTRRNIPIKCLDKFNI